MCSAPWYWKTRRMSGERPITQQVADEDRDPDQALDEVLDQAVVGARTVVTDAMNSGSRKKTPMPGDEGQREHQRDRALAELDALVRRLDVRAPDEPAGADDERLVQDDEAADERRACDQRVPWKTAVERAPWRTTISPSGWRSATRDRVATAHQDALDEGLTAVGEAGHGRQSTGASGDRRAAGIDNGGPSARRPGRTRRAVS